MIDLSRVKTNSSKLEPSIGQDRPRSSSNFAQMHVLRESDSSTGAAMQMKHVGVLE